MFSGFTTLRFGAMMLLLAAAVSLLSSTSVFRTGSTAPALGVSGGVIPEEARSRTGVDLARRADSPTDVCIRWAQQSAVVNGTLYLYGGQASTQSGQQDNTWNNDFLTLDLTKSWQIASPSLTGLPQPSGPPAVALGYLWNSDSSLFMYGGEFSSKPATSPVPFALWEYDIASSSWIEHSNPETSSGNSAPSNNVPVQRSAEGAGVSVPSLGRGFYFGGHLDGYTTPGWSQSIERVYLQSLLEYTYPGSTNDQVTALQNGQTASSDGVYRNVTQGGLQSSAGFTKRADGLLIYVPGFGPKGILLALAGGTNTTFTQMNEIDVYDIESSTWYIQSTSGPTPNIRVNPCAVIAAAPDGSSLNIYMWAGQSLQPFGDQTLYQDMWILTLPSFTWIEVDQSGQSVPYPRAGQTCNVWDGQMVTVGGYVGDQLSCETPAIYVFNLTSLQWAQQFTALSDSNPLNQQPAQAANATNAGGLQGSFGYQVPAAVISVVGGSPNGGATVTTPAKTPAGGPLATGSPITYTLPNGATVTESPGSSNPGTVSAKSSGPNIAAIVVGVVCGLLFCVVCYLAFCAFVYRKQVKLYKNHLDMAQRHGHGEKAPALAGLLATGGAAKTSSDRRFDGHSVAAAGGSGESGSQTGSHSGSQGYSASGGRANNSSAYQSVRRSSDGSLGDVNLTYSEPTFVGVMLSPRRSLRVVNRD